MQPPTAPFPSHQLYAPADHHDSLRYIDALFDWTARHNLTVMLDLHGGPGSQNGIDHSGCGWSMGGPKWTQPTNIHLSLKVTPRLGPYQSPCLGPCLILI